MFEDFEHLLKRISWRLCCDIVEWMEEILRQIVNV